MADLKSCPHCGGDAFISGEFAGCTDCEVWTEVDIWNRRALSHPAPVQADHSEQVLDMVKAEQSLEVIGDSYSFMPPAPDSPSLPHRRVWVQGVNVTDHAKATAALAQKDVEIAHWKELGHDKYWQQVNKLSEENATLRAQIAEAEKDAQSWRQYQARKQAIIAAGMGKNPLRDAALSSQQEGEK